MASTLGLALEHGLDCGLGQARGLNLWTIGCCVMIGLQVVQQQGGLCLALTSQWQGYMHRMYTLLHGAWCVHSPAAAAGSREAQVLHGERVLRAYAHTKTHVHACFTTFPAYLCLW